ncbi:hypothetical protein SH580_10250 [Coraliomargarita algicola]|uniref:Co-chaperone DjlA N-terminal domain-containing protein n=1 Tax=Coraliomargarita algicola TaxID=3092156 RepID=A0ABZ0RSY0_9BACT|nr:hypothetical protein [Coraliomargarita sp. J2-16]WPJ98080.1 hypothetical protein SH580_10250 [Coraliomargarita sp. J2-16]
MKFLEKLFSQESRATPESELQQAEREAIIDLLLMAIYVDQHLSLAETKEFDHAADSLGWDSSTGPSVYICNATDRARTARISEELTADFIAYVAERLSENSKPRALELLNRLFQSDGLTDKEKGFLQQVRVAFGSA